MIHSPAKHGTPTLLSIGAAFGLSLLALAATPSHGFADAANYRQTVKATVWVLCKTSDGVSSGAGVLIDRDRKLVLTNAHVVGDCRNAVLFFPDMKDDRPIVEKSHYLENVKKLGVRGRIVAVDRKRDLALVQIANVPEGAEALSLAEQSTFPGEVIESIGNPGASSALWVYTSGTVRAVYKKQFRTGAGEHEFTVVETQSPINPGDSGGPVVDQSGKLIGVVQAVAKKGNQISYCVDVTEVQDFLSSPWKPAPLPVKDLLEQAEMKYEQHASGHYQIQFPLDDDKSQTVFVTKDSEYYERADVRKVWSLAATLAEAPGAETTLQLLQLNARTKIGSWSIEQDQEQQYRVIYLVKMDATATGDVLKSTVGYAAKMSNSMAQQLQPKESAKTSAETLSEWLGDN